jgi:phosphatidate phosphatase PAH1
MMKKFALFFILLAIVSISFKAVSQEQIDKFDPNEKLYWFYLSVSIRLYKEIKRNIYVISGLSKTPIYGTIAEYEKELWKCLQKGRKLAIGPFLDNKLTQKAIEIYALAKLPINLRDNRIKKLLESSIDTMNFYYYFLPKRESNYHPLRIPKTNIEKTSLNNFIELYLEGLAMEMIAIGPFVTRPEAEESKRLNRL